MSHRCRYCLLSISKCKHVNPDILPRSATALDATSVVLSASRREKITDVTALHQPFDVRRASTQFRALVADTH